MRSLLLQPRTCPRCEGIRTGFLLTVAGLGALAWGLMAREVRSWFR